MKKLDLPFAGEAPGDVLTGGQPTAAHLDEARAAGFRTVINLRPADEPGQLADPRAEVEARGMTYVHLPVAGAAGVTLENARTLAAALAKDGATPAIVHCASSNRVGALFALKARHLDGKGEEEAVEIGKRAGLTGLEAHVRSLL